jgi:hypothetical protein
MNKLPQKIKSIAAPLVKRRGINWPTELAFKVLMVYYSCGLAPNLNYESGLWSQ